jgi:hypothetical protein
MKQNADIQMLMNLFQKSSLNLSVFLRTKRKRQRTTVKASLVITDCRWRLFFMMT